MSSAFPPSAPVHSAAFSENLSQLIWNEAFHEFSLHLRATRAKKRSAIMRCKSVASFAGQPAKMCRSLTLVSATWTAFSYNFNYISVSYVSGTNLVQTITDATGCAITLGYSSGILTTLTDPKGQQWGVAYTRAGDLWHVSDAAVPFAYNYRTFAYNAAHDITQMQDHNNQNYLGYNADNTLAWEKDLLDNQTNFAYSSTGATTTNPNGHALTHLQCCRSACVRHRRPELHRILLV